MAPPKKKNYTAEFNKYVKSAQAAKSAGVPPPQSFFDAVLSKDERFTKPLLPDPHVVASERAQAIGNAIAGPNVGSAIIDVISRPWYATGSYMENEAQNLVDHFEGGQPDKSVGDKLGGSASAFWAGLSGENKISPDQVLNKFAPKTFNTIGLGLTSGLLGGPAGTIEASKPESAIAKFLASLAIGGAIDPLNVAGPLISGGRAIVRAKKGLDTLEEAKAAATVAISSDRAVPKARVAEIEAAQTAEEVKTAVAKASGSVKTDEITRQVAERAKLDPAITAPKMLSHIEADPEMVNAVNNGIKAAHTNVLADGGYGNAAQANMVTRITNETAKKINLNSEFQGPRWAQTRLTQIAEDAIPKIKFAEDAAESVGIRHYVKSGSGEREWAVKPSDWMEILDPTVVKAIHWGTTKKVNPHAISAGIAKGLDLAESGLKKTETVKQMISAMQKSGPRARSVHSYQYAATNIYNKIPEFLTRVGVNRAKAGLKHGEDFTKITARELENLHGSLDAAPSVLATQVNKIVPRITAEAKSIGATDTTAILAQERVADELAGVMDKSDLAWINESKKAGAAVRAGEPAAAREIIAKATKRQVNDVLEEAKKAGITLNRDEIVEIDLLVTQSRLGKIFSGYKQGAKTMFEVWRSQGGFGHAGFEIGEFNKGLDKLRKVPTTELQSALSKIKTDEASGFPDLDALVHKALDPVDGPMGQLWRNGAEMKQINAVLRKSFAGKKTYQFDDTLTDDIVEITNQWKNWDIDDPLDFLHRMYDATRKLAGHQTVAISAENRFGSLVKKAGYVKIIGRDEDLITPHLNPDMWFPKDIADGFNHLEYAAGSPRTFAARAKEGHPGAKFINDFYDKWLSTWKIYVTLLRPGYHPRNVFGDAILSNLAGMNNVAKHYGNAANLLTHRDPTFVMNVTLGGKRVQVTGDQAIRLFDKNGLRPNFHLSEDIISESAKTKLGKAIVDNRAIRFMGGVSEKETVWAKMAQFLFELERIKGGISIEHKAAMAAREVRKWHPDSSGLKPFEARVMRRIIPFYSWVRQALPLVAEATVTKPGRVLALPKANYDLAVANGTDPNSISDQWSDQENYPSYFTSNILGPVGNNGVGFNFGSPVEAIYGDVLNDMLNQPVDHKGMPFGGKLPMGFVDSLTPFIKAPVELGTSTRLATGRNIYDKGEYVDSIIPFVSNFSQISGYSPSGTVTNLVGYGTGPVPDPMRSYLTGEKKRWWNEAMVNFFTGIGIKDYNRQSDLNNGLKEIKAGRSG